MKPIEIPAYPSGTVIADLDYFRDLIDSRLYFYVDLSITMKRGMVMGILSAFYKWDIITGEEYNLLEDEYFQDGKLILVRGRSK